MKDIECEIQLALPLNSDDDVLNRTIGDKRIVREGLETFFRQFLENQVKAELGTAYRVPTQIPIRYGTLPSGNVAVMKVFLPEQNEILKHKLTLMLVQDIKSEFGEKAMQYAGLVDYQHQAA